MGLVARLSTLVAALLIASFVLTLAAAQYFFDRYMLETSQRLSREIAPHIATDLKLYQDGALDKAQLKALAHDAMIINPNLEVYVLDQGGEILGHALPEASVDGGRVDLAPVMAFLAGDHSYPLLGDDPRSAEQKIFSAAALRVDGEAVGYVYVVLRGQLFGGLAERLRGSYVWPVALVALLALLLSVACLSLFLMRWAVAPLRRLIDRVAATDIGNASDLRRLSKATSGAPHELATLQTTLGTMSERLVSQYAELDRADQLRRELVSNVSHDLRTPLTTIQGYLETLLLKELPEEKREDYLRRAFRGSERLGDLIANLFELAKLDAGMGLASLEACSVAEVAQDVVQELALEAQRKSLTLDLDVSAPCFVMADIGLLQRVFENLIGNAIRYTPEGGEISVAVLQVDGAVNVSVRDNGIGIAAEDTVSIFDRYRTIDDPEAPTREATGLGLAIVKRILELHDSVIQLRSTPRQGSEFFFSLRDAPAPA
ncbi:MAG: HAMP domain-containing sensor histidine kinase [Pseudomonadota bacterium]